MKTHGKITFVIIVVQILMLVNLFAVSAQDKINTYFMSSFSENKPLSFDISLSDDKDLWIDVFSPYKPGSRCGFKLDEYNKSNFITTVLQAKSLFTVWKEMAIENNFQDIKKKMHFIFYTNGYFSNLDMLRHDENVQLIFAFTYFKNNYVLIIGLDNMTDKDNELITFEGGSIVFNSEDEIDNFLDKISTESIINLQAKKKP